MNFGRRVFGVINGLILECKNYAKYNFLMQINILLRICIYLWFWLFSQIENVFDRPSKAPVSRRAPLVVGPVCVRGLLKENILFEYSPQKPSVTGSQSVSEKVYSRFSFSSKWRNDLDNRILSYFAINFTIPGLESIPRTYQASSYDTIDVTQIEDR